MIDPELLSPRYLLWSVQRAMLDEVTPELRGVAVGVDDNHAWGRFLYENYIDSAMKEHVDDIETEVIADYCGLFPVEFTAIHVPVERPRVLGPNECWAYLRYEA